MGLLKSKNNINNSSVFWCGFRDWIFTKETWVGHCSYIRSHITTVTRRELTTDCRWKMRKINQINSSHDVLLVLLPIVRSPASLGSGFYVDHTVQPCFFVALRHLTDLFVWWIRVYGPCYCDPSQLIGKIIVYYVNLYTTWTIPEQYMHLQYELDYTT